MSVIVAFGVCLSSCILKSGRFKLLASENLIIWFEAYANALHIMISRIVTLPKNAVGYNDFALTIFIEKADCLKKYFISIYHTLKLNHKMSM